MHLSVKEILDKKVPQLNPSNQQILQSDIKKIADLGGRAV
jgi:hypothetical protein